MSAKRGINAKKTKPHKAQPVPVNRWCLCLFRIIAITIIAALSLLLMEQR